MKLRNDFSELTRALYIFEKVCWNCGREASELHHVMSRTSNSPLNAYVICRKCHENYTSLSKYELLKKAFIFLIRKNYKFKERDYIFMENNRIYYEKIIKEIKNGK